MSFLRLDDEKSNKKEEFCIINLDYVKSIKLTVVQTEKTTIYCVVFIMKDNSEVVKGEFKTKKEAISWVDAAMDYTIYGDEEEDEDDWDEDNDDDEDEEGEDEDEDDEDEEDEDEEEDEETDDDE